MPRGVYERKPRGEKAVKDEGGGSKAKRKYTRKTAGKPDTKALALEAFTGAAENLARSVRETVEMDDAPELASALRTFEICSKIYAAL